MWYSFAANLVLIAHMTFVALVIFGGLGWLRWRWAPWIHLPTAGWGVYIELSGQPCPLTTLENELLRAAGEGGYETSFIAHYLLSVLYPEGLTRDIQLMLGGAVVAANVVIYAWIWKRGRSSVGR